MYMHACNVNAHLAKPWIFKFYGYLTMKYTWNFTFWKYKYVWMQKPYFATPISLGGNFYLAGGK